VKELHILLNVLTATNLSLNNTLVYTIVKVTESLREIFYTLLVDIFILNLQKLSIMDLHMVASHMMNEVLQKNIQN
jgi:hypothetical protein